MKNLRRPNAYERAIEKLWKDILTVGGRVKEQLDLAMKALVYQDEDKAYLVFQIEDEVDEIDEDIEIRALELISIQQPLTEQLRTLAGIMKIMSNLERVSDYSVNIAEIAIKLSGMGEYFKPLVDIPKMSDMAREMIDKALTAYSEKNTELAMEVIASDDKVDDIFSLLYDELIDYMKKDPIYVEQASHLTFVARYLERIGDHAENIAETVNFIVSGNKRI